MPSEQAVTTSAPAVQESRKQIFKSWHATHGNARYSPDFISALDAVIHDQDRSAQDRVMAWAKRYAWGNASDFAIDDATRRPLRMKDCARELGVSEPSVSRAFAYFEAKSECVIKGLRIFPVIDPVAERAKKQGTQISEVQNSDESEPVDAATLFNRFVETVWSQGHEEEAAEWLRAQQLKAESAAIESKLRPLILNEFKQWRRKQDKAVRRRHFGCAASSADVEHSEPAQMAAEEEVTEAQAYQEVANTGRTQISQVHNSAELAETEQPAEKSLSYDPRATWEAFRVAYPKDARIHDAWLWWRANVRTAEYAAEILAGLHRHIGSDEWQRNIGVPWAISFLQKHRYREHPRPAVLRRGAAAAALPDSNQLRERINAKRRRS